MEVCEYLDQEGVPSAGFPTMRRLGRHWRLDARLRGLWRGKSAADRAAGALRETSDSCAGTAQRDRRGRAAHSEEAAGGRSAVLADQTQVATAAAVPEEAQGSRVATGPHRGRDL